MSPVISPLARIDFWLAVGVAGWGGVAALVGLGVLVARVLS